MPLQISLLFKGRVPVRFYLFICFEWEGVSLFYFFINGVPTIKGGWRYSITCVKGRVPILFYFSIWFKGRACHYSSICLEGLFYPTLWYSSEPYENAIVLTRSDTRLSVWCGEGGRHTAVPSLKITLFSVRCVSLLCSWGGLSYLCKPFSNIWTSILSYLVAKFRSPGSILSYSVQSVCLWCQNKAWLENIMSW